jgi:murein DD-endopeptidase MepM/ murein hydrolase activator NlpD
MKRFALVLALAPLLLAATTPPDQETEHVVKEGETLGGVAERAKVPRILIIESNRLEEPYALKAGQKLIIPRTRQHVVRSGDTGFSVAYDYGVSWPDIAVANGLDAAAALTPGQKLLIPTVISSPAPEPVVAAPAAAPKPAPSAAAPAPAPAPTAVRFAWPLAGPVRRGFTARSAGSDYHNGLDITVPDGTAVRASAAGKVSFAGAGQAQFGNMVVIEHPGGWSTAYAFLSRVTVKVGEEVRQGERVGLSGHTGRARGPELHFELRRGERAVDPAPQLPKRS